MAHVVRVELLDVLGAPVLPHDALLLAISRDFKYASVTVMRVPATGQMALTVTP